VLFALIAVSPLAFDRFKMLSHVAMAAIIRTPLGQCRTLQMEMSCFGPDVKNEIYLQ